MPSAKPPEPAWNQATPALTPARPRGRTHEHVHPQPRASAGDVPLPDQPSVLVAPPWQDAPPAPLTPEALGVLAASLRERRANGIGAMPVDEIAVAAGRALATFAEPRAEDVEALADVTGYHPAMVRTGLTDLARTFDAAALRRLLRRELPEPAALDGFAPRADGHGHERAMGPGLTVTVLAGNVFPVAVEGMVLPLLAKSPCLVKASRRDPLFPVLCARALAATDARIAASLAVVSWPGGAVAFDGAALAAAEAVIVYGGSEAVAAVRALTPPHARFLAHGPKLSFAVVGPGADLVEAAADAAHDVSAYDQQGCVAPHTVYVVGEGARALAFARALAEALEREAGRIPSGAISAADAATIQQARGAAEFRAGVEVFTGAGTSWTVIFDPLPDFAVSCLNRFVHVKPLARPTDLLSLLAPLREYVQTVGVAGDARFRLRVAELTASLGVARVCPLGRMAHPLADWRHDGRPRMLDLLRWTDLDT